MLISSVRVSLVNLPFVIGVPAQNSEEFRESYFPRKITDPLSSSHCIQCNDIGLITQGTYKEPCQGDGKEQLWKKECWTFGYLAITHIEKLVKDFALWGQIETGF